MPKKWGIDPRCVESRARKAAIKESRLELEQKTREDLLWVDNNKIMEVKVERKREVVEKKQEEKKRKEENKLIEAKETKILLKEAKKAEKAKITAAKIEAKRIAELANIKVQIKKENEQKFNEFIESFEENSDPNYKSRDQNAKLKREGTVLVKSSESRDTVQVLEEVKVFRHSGGKIGKAWSEFVRENSNRYKTIYYNLERSKRMYIMHTDFENSDKNPNNIPHVELNTKLN